jgi:hypothetical protein
MKTKKSSRKIKSGNKMVRIALHKQKILHEVNIAGIVTICNATIIAIQAQRMAKDGVLTEEISNKFQGEAVLLLEDVKKINKNVELFNKS